MRLHHLLIFLALMSAFAIGISLSEKTQLDIVDSAINNVSIIIDNITLSHSDYSNQTINMNGFFLVVEKYIKFIGTLAFETMRVGIKFGFENPDYFSPEHIIYIAQLIVWLVIISLLIKPIGYVIIFIIMGGIWIKDRVKTKPKQTKQRRKN